jgi:hypothetical protein
MGSALVLLNKLEGQRLGCGLEPGEYLTKPWVVLQIFESLLPVHITIMPCAARNLDVKLAKWPTLGRGKNG